MCALSRKVQMNRLNSYVTYCFLQFLLHKCFMKSEITIEKKSSHCYFVKSKCFFVLFPYRFFKVMDDFMSTCGEGEFASYLISHSHWYTYTYYIKKKKILVNFCLRKKLVDSENRTMSLSYSSESRRQVCCNVSHWSKSIVLEYRWVVLWKFQDSCLIGAN